MSNLHLKTNPTLADIQQYVRDMEAERGFTEGNIAQACLFLMEEVGELVKSIRKSHLGLRTDSAKKYDDDAAGELADIIIFLASIANRLDIDLEQAFRNKEEANKQRTWQ